MKKIFRIVILFSVLLIAGACQAKKDILILAGSRSVTPIVEILSESFRQNNPKIQIDIQGGGSSAGITAANEGAADIGMVSRNLTPDDPALVETIIAYDGVAIIVHPANPVNALNLDQLRAIYAGEVKNWSEIGGTDAPIVLIDKEEGSGTRDVFIDQVMGEGTSIVASAIVMDGTGAARAAVAADTNAIGYISFASVTAEVKALSVDGVMPTPEQVIAGNYLIYRPFVLVTKDKPARMAQKFLDYALSAEGQALVEQNDLIAVSNR